MPKLKIGDLDRIRERMKKVISLREGTARVRVTVHMGTCGISAGAREIMSTLIALFDGNHVNDVTLTTSGCAGLCSREPMATVELKGEAPVKYVDLTEEKIKKIFYEHILKGNIVPEFALARGCERVL